MATTDGLYLMIAASLPSQGARGLPAATCETLHSDRDKKRSRNVVLPQS